MTALLSRADRFPVMRLTDVERQISMERLRAYRLARVREQLAKRGLTGCCLFDPVNSRTFFCGPGRPSARQRELYRLAYEELAHNMALIKPGVTFRELAERAWPIPEIYRENRYVLMLHGIGMCDEWPWIAYRYEWDQNGYDGVIQENMTICVESFMAPAGATEGVKLERQVLVTAEGARPLDTFPFEEELLG
jgi:Xaa-Pro aminopeptidase